MLTLRSDTLQRTSARAIRRGMVASALGFAATTAFAQSAIDIPVPGEEDWRKERIIDINEVNALELFESTDGSDSELVRHRAYRKCVQEASENASKTRSEPDYAQICRRELAALKSRMTPPVRKAAEQVERTNTQKLRAQRTEDARTRERLAEVTTSERDFARGDSEELRNSTRLYNCVRRAERTEEFEAANCEARLGLTNEDLTAIEDVSRQRREQLARDTRTERGN